MLEGEKSVCAVFDFHQTLAVYSGVHDRYTTRRLSRLENIWIDIVSRQASSLERFAQDLDAAVSILVEPYSPDARLIPPTYVDRLREFPLGPDGVRFKSVITQWQPEGWHFAPPQGDSYYEEQVKRYILSEEMCDVVTYLSDNGAEILVVSNMPYGQKEAIEDKLRPIQGKIDQIILRPEELPTNTPCIKKAVIKLKRPHVGKILFFDDDPANIREVEDDCDVLGIPQTIEQLGLQPDFQRQAFEDIIAREIARGTKKTCISGVKPWIEYVKRMNLFT